MLFRSTTLFHPLPTPATYYLLNVPITRPPPPNAGLDSMGAHVLMKALERLKVKMRMAIVCTIHQPSKDLFWMFDRSSPPALFFHSQTFVFHHSCFLWDIAFCAALRV